MNGRTITEADVVAFANLTGDQHPQHTDARWAGQGPFGERIAHGMLVLSYAVGLVDFDPERIVALRGSSDVVFKRPVTIGDTIRVEVAPVRRATQRGLESLRVAGAQPGRPARAARAWWRRSSAPRSDEPAQDDELAAVPVTL